MVLNMTLRAWHGGFMGSKKNTRNMRMAFLCGMLAVCLNVYGLHAQSAGPENADATGKQAYLPVVTSRES